MSDIIAPQPDPVPNDNPAAWDLVVVDFMDGLGSQTSLTQAVIEDMRGRDQFGLAKYGVRIQAWNGRDNLIDAYQEVLDGAVYLRSALFETPEESDAYSELMLMYKNTFALILRLRRAIWARDGA